MKKDLKKCIDKVLSEFSKRDRDVLVKRFGLNHKRLSLQRIGDFYGISRERVRQIEEKTLNDLCSENLRKSLKSHIDDLYTFINKQGGFASEKTILDLYLKNDEKLFPYVQLLISVSNNCNLDENSKEYHPIYFTNEKVRKNTEEILKSIHKKVDKKKIYSNNEILKLFQDEINKSDFKNTNSSIIVKGLREISKKIEFNKFNEWGHVEKDEITPKRLRDYIKIMFRKDPTPKHFTDVHKYVSKIIPKKRTVSSCHNELVSCDDFVKIGRGIYCLKKDLKYKGDLCQTIIEILKTKYKGSATLDQIFKEVIKERNIRKSSVIKYLSDKTLFRKNTDDTYSYISTY